VIFFIVSKKRRSAKDWMALKAGSADKAVAYTDDGWVIIAWNEVFASLDELRECVYAVANADAVCLDIRAQAIARFGIDPFLKECDGGNVDKVTMEKMVATTFRYWAHPSIGNITLSPNLRPTPVASPPFRNWSECNLLDADTKLAIERLPDLVGSIDRSRRDQVRICTNVTELARAIIGEISCEASRRLEKLLALRLCRSERLLEEQRGLLQAMQDEKTQWMTKVMPTSFEWRSCEYTRYYLGTPSTKDAWPLFATLLNDATGGKYPKPRDALSSDAQTKFRTWQMLPTPIRCAILMNDLRKVGGKGAPANPRKKSMCMVATTLPLGRGKDPAYQIGDSAGQVLTELQGRPWGLAWSWNRDEYATPTITYRHFLCPLWAGASGHTGGALTFWPWAIAKPLTVGQTAAVATGLFTVWRLYYDKRISANHTLTETFEATCEPFAKKNVQLTVPDKAKLPTVGPDDDAYLLVERCSAMSGGFVDPILLLRAIAASYVRGSTFAEQFAALDEDIDKERKLLSVQFTVPVWSWALDAKQGLATTSFAQKYLSPSPSPSPLSSVALVTKPSDTAVEAVATLTKKDDGVQ
jgi:hypothetical protein